MSGYHVNLLEKKNINNKNGNNFSITGRQLLSLFKNISPNKDDEVWNNLVYNLRKTRQLPSSFSDNSGFVFDDNDFFSRTTTRPRARIPQWQQTTEAIPGNQARIPDCVFYCPSTSEYNPVCGTDNVTYSNLSKLKCAQNCGISKLSLINSNFVYLPIYLLD